MLLKHVAVGAVVVIGSYTVQIFNGAGHDKPFAVVIVTGVALAPSVTVLYNQEIKINSYKHLLVTCYNRIPYTVYI